MPNRFAGTVRAPQFPEGKDWIGDPVTLADLRGKIVLLDFWTSCCINCMHVLAPLHEIEQRHRDEVVVIGVHSAKFPYEQKTANVRAAVERLGIHHRVINDGDHALWDAYAVRAWPTLMVIDPAGRVIGKHEGEFELESFDQFIAEAIAEFDAEGKIDRTPLREALLPETPATLLRFPAKIAADNELKRLFIADTSHHRVIETDFSGNIRRIHGGDAPGFIDGPKGAGRFNRPHGVALAQDGRTLAVADIGNHAVRSIDLETGAIDTLAGTGEQGYDRDGGIGPETALASPWDLIWHDGALWIAMAGWHQIWRYDPATNLIDVAAGTGAESIHDGTLEESTFAQPSGIALAGDRFFIADSESSAIRAIDMREDRVRRLVGRGLFTFGDIDARGDSVRLQHPLGVAGTGDGDHAQVYIADSYNNKIKVLAPLTRGVTTLFGSGDTGHDDGDADEVTFWEPGGLALAGDRIFVADTNNHAIRVCDLLKNQVTTLELKS
jgi:DNA-binding beta-propeller fold protein YncE